MVQKKGSIIGEKRIKPFNWKDSFKETFNNGGFDIVIGNPPYFNINTLNKKIIKYLEEHYSTIHTGYNDIMYYFIYKGISLLKTDGVCGLITSNYFLGNKYAGNLRVFLKNHITSLVNFKDFFVFPGVNIHTCIILSAKEPRNDLVSFYEFNDNNLIKSDLLKTLKKINLKRNDLKESWLIAEGPEIEIIEKIRTHQLLGEVAIIEKGSTSGKNSVFTISEEFAKSRKLEKELLRKNVKNGDIERYFIKDREQLLIYIENETEITKFPNILSYLTEHKSELQDRNEVKNKLYEWYRLERPRNKSIFDSSEKIIVPYRSDRNRFAYDDSQYFNDGGDIRAIVSNKVNIKYLLGILNSSLIDWYYGFIGKPKGKSREYFNEPLSQIPIPAIDFNNQKFRKIHDQIVECVDQIIKDKKELKVCKLQSRIDLITAKIEFMENKIDDLVFGLFELTEDQIKFITKN